jgi:hypothetical protein
MFQSVEVNPTVDVSSVRAVMVLLAAAAAGSRRQGAPARACVRSEAAMRTATLVLVAYLCCRGGGVAAAAVGSRRGPDVGALTAAYLGLTARRQVSPAIGGAIVLGYLIDLISGAPPGLIALVLALTTLVARAVQQRILVRGAAISIAFSAFVALVAGVLALVVRVLYRMPSAAFAIELQHVAFVTIATAISGRWCGGCSAASTPRLPAPTASATPRSRPGHGAAHVDPPVVGPGLGQRPALPSCIAGSAGRADRDRRAVVLVGRLWQLQVMRGESYYERTVSNVVKERYLPSVRGKILDRKGVRSPTIGRRSTSTRRRSSSPGARGRAGAMLGCPTTRSPRSTSARGRRKRDPRTRS